MNSLDTILEGRRSQPHQVIEVLQDVQEQFGYVPETAMNIIASELGVPLMEVYRVASFYKAFSLKPRGKNILTVCTGTACHVRGAKLLIDQLRGQLKVQLGDTTGDGLMTVDKVNCVGACALGPVVLKNDLYLHHVTPGKLKKILQNLSPETEKKESPHEQTESNGRS